VRLETTSCRLGIAFEPIVTLAGARGREREALGGFRAGPAPKTDEYITLVCGGTSPGHLYRPDIELWKLHLAPVGAGS